MKRSIALLLTVIMVLGMVPASLLSAMAHGIGVGNNNINNLSIDNAPNQQVPATVIVDGKSDDTAWAYEDWNNVDSTKGLWSVTTAKNPNFSYKYQLHYDYEFLYGIFVIDTNGIFSGSLGDITVWLNDSGVTTYTDKIVLTKDGTCTVYNGTTVVSDKGAESKYGTDIYSQLCSVENKDGVYTIEFRTLLKNITEDDVPVLRSYASVAVGDEQLYYPRFATESSDIDPAAAWPVNSVTITRWETTATHNSGQWGTHNGDFSKITPSEFNIDGELDEPFWQSFTDYSRQDSNPYDYVNDNLLTNGYNLTDLSVGYSGSMYYYDIEDGYVNVPRENADGDMVLDDPVTFVNNGITTSDKNKYYYDAQYLDLYSSPMSFKYDVRSDDEYFYGAVLAKVDCSDEEIYYHIKKYEDENGTPADGTALIVPVYFYVVFTAGYDATGTQNTAYTLKLMYNTEVVYNANLSTWEFSGVYGEGHNEVIYGYNYGYGTYIAGDDAFYPVNDDGTNPVDENGKKISSVTYINNNIRSYVGAKRLNRYLISFEFKLPYKALGLMDQNGNYYKDGKFTEDEFKVYHTVAMSNSYSMYSRYPEDIAESTGTTTKRVKFYSFGYVDSTTGDAVEYKSGDTGNDGVAATLSPLPGKYYVYESEYDFSYYKTFDLGYHAYHAWSQGGGNSGSLPVVAVKNSTVNTPTNLKTDGVLESSYWANILAADVIINGMGRHVNSDVDNDNLDFRARGEENASDGIIGSFYHELAMDDEYLYGAALIIDGDGEWLTKTVNDNKYDVFRLWVQSGAPRYGERIDYIVNFYIDETIHNSKTIPVCDITTSLNQKIATSVSLSETDAGNSDAENSINMAGHGIEVGMKVVSDYKLREIVDDTYLNSGEGYYTTDLAVLEFKIPLSLLGIDSEIYDATAFNYSASMEYMGHGGNQGLVWPLYDNEKAIQSGYIALDTVDTGTWGATQEDLKYKAGVAYSLADEYSLAGLKSSERRATTLVLDGGLSESVWDDEEDRVDVNINTGTSVGTWVESPSTEDCFGYSHKIWTGREYIYGGVIIDAELSGDDSFVLWINSDGGSVATHKFEFMIEDGASVCYKTNLSTSSRTLVTFTDYVTNSGTGYEARDGGMFMNVVNGKTYLEFKLPMDEFQDVVVQNVYDGSTIRGTYEYHDDYKYCISVNHKCDDKTYTLYYPDNSNIGSRETATLWLTHYNMQAPGAGSIIYSPMIAQGLAANYWRQVYFSPTEYEGIYKCDGYIESLASSGFNTLYDAWNSIYPNGIPQGSFVYCSQSSNTASINVGGECYSGLNYNCVAMNRIRDYVGYNIGCYVRFDGIDLSDDNRIKTPYDDRIARAPQYYEDGYCTNATFTVVTLDNEISESDLPQNDFGDEYEIIEFVGYYIPEDITIDGSISDAEWNKDRWITVVDDVNGNTNNLTYKNCDTDFSYKYQIRMDDEYVYVAAVADGLSAYSDATSTPAFRIWIQSKDSEYNDAVSFTHFFDVHAVATGGTGTNLYSQDNPNMLTNINAEIQAYQAHYMPVENGVNASLTVDGSSAEGLLGTTGSFGNYDWVYLGIPESVIKAATHNGFKKPQGGLNNTVDVLTYGDTSFYGETVFHAENENTGKNTQEYEADWYASINLTEVELADQHAIMTQNANGNMQVEFRFALSDIGCEDGDDFEYYVEARSETSEPNTSYCLYYPSLPLESCSYPGSYALSYNLPYWHWSDTAIVVDAEAREAMRLRNPIEPITSLGAQVNESYTDAEGNTFKALKFGILYNQKYLDRVNGRTDWTGAENIYENATYWDVKELGIVLDITDYLGLDGYKTVLYTDTPFVTNEDSDAIENQKSDSNMADYESYVSYVVCKIPDGQEASNLTYRGYVEYYPHDDLYYDHWWLTDNTADDGLEDGWTFRPTYYSDPLTRNYNLVKEKADENTEIVIPVSDILVKLNISNTVTNTNHEVLEDDTFIIEIGNENGYAPYEIDGTLEFPISYSLENVGTHTYYIRQKNDGKDNVTYDDTEYTVTVDVAFDEDNNRLVPTITVNNGGAVSGNMINVSYDVTYDHTKNNTKVVYVPLDNRPVNLDRAEYLALSAGIDLVMPPESIISTTLDTNTAYGTTSSDQGDVEELFTWLQQQDADYYALSLDQLFSGGLVGSRAPFYDTEDSIARMNQTLGSYQLSAKEEEIVEYLTTLADTEGKYVVFFDTIMRLASTSGYAGMVGGEYNFLRYQYTLEDRKDLSGDALNIDQIVANYQYGANGTKLSTYFNKSGCEDYDGYGTTFSQTLVDQYCLARERKLRIADALYSSCINNVDSLFIGVDDSMGQETIHTNEMNYLKQEYDLDTRDNALLFDGADELGLVALANVVSELHTNINVSIQYFGGYENEVADSYGPGTLKESVEKHIIASGGNVVSDAANADMQVLVVTRPFAKIAYFNTSGAEGYDQHVTNCTALVEKLKTNLANNIPTCVIDGTCYGGYGPLADQIVAEAKAGNLALAEVMGFSAWNTTGNATGIALGNAVARVAYLKNYTVVPNENIKTTGIQSDSHAGFYKSILYSYIKDAVYKKNTGTCFNHPNKFLSLSEDWIKAINTNTAMYTGIGSNGYGQVANASNVRVTDLTFPWNRNFEADFDFRFYTHGTNVEVENDPDSANGMSYTVNGIVGGSYPDSGNELTDGTMISGTSAAYSNSNFVGYQLNNSGKAVEIEFDFSDSPIDLYKASAQIITAGSSGITAPAGYEVYVQKVGSSEWVLVNSLSTANGDYTAGTTSSSTCTVGWVGGFISGDGTNAAKVKIRFTGSTAWLFVSEINIQGLEPGFN